jgi:tRNA threonylcarbamoyladenosine biosynthesis protein TsaE
MAILRQNSIDFNSSSVEQTERLGFRLGQLLVPFDVLALQGDLGAGKTALARGIAAGWGTAVRVTSPTYTLIHEYPRAEDGCLLYHLDCYRLGGEADAETLGLEDIFERTAVVMVEWPERIPHWLPAEHLVIELTYLNATRRSLHFTAHGTRAEALLREFKQAAFGA